MNRIRPKRKHDRKIAAEQNPQFTLNGFRQVTGFRVFSFDRRVKDGPHETFTVETDLELIHRYRIPLQELPSLCKEVLEQHHHGGEQRVFSLDQDAMRRYADCEAARAEIAKNRKTPRRNGSENRRGAAWRGTRL